MYTHIASLTASTEHNLIFPAGLRVTVKNTGYETQKKHINYCNAS